MQQRSALLHPIDMPAAAAERRLTARGYGSRVTHGQVEEHNGFRCFPNLDDARCGAVPVDLRSFSQRWRRSCGFEHESHTAIANGSPRSTSY